MCCIVIPLHQHDVTQKSYGFLQAGGEKPHPWATPYTITLTIHSFTHGIITKTHSLLDTFPGSNTDEVSYLTMFFLNLSLKKCFILISQKH